MSKEIIDVKAALGPEGAKEKFLSDIAAFYEGAEHGVRPYLCNAEPKLA